MGQDRDPRLSYDPGAVFFAPSGRIRRISTTVIIEAIYASIANDRECCLPYSGYSHPLVSSSNWSPAFMESPAGVRAKWVASPSSAAPAPTFWFVCPADQSCESGPSLSRDDSLGKFVLHVIRCSIKVLIKHRSQACFFLKCACSPQSPLYVPTLPPFLCIFPHVDWGGWRNGIP